MQREQITFTTPSGKNTIVFNSYLTGREKRAMNAIYLKEAGDLASEEVKAKGLRGYIIEAVQDLLIKTLVVSVNGKTGADMDIANYLLDLKSSEYEAVSKKINDIVKEADSSEDAEKKTN